MYRLKRTRWLLCSPSWSRTPILGQEHYFPEHRNWVEREPGELGMSSGASPRGHRFCHHSGIAREQGPRARPRARHGSAASPTHGESARRPCALR